MSLTTPPNKPPPEASHCHDSPLDHCASGPSEYTRRHREAWPLLVRSPEIETFEASALTSWRDLWGRLGEELYRCFRDGDAHIHANMILLARQFGGRRGRLVAGRLEEWLQDLAA